MKPFFFVLLSFLAYATGADANESRYSRIDFVPSFKGIKQTNLPQKLLSASPSLIFSRKDKLEAHCSGSIVSDNGNILTAGHCISECLSQIGATIDSRDVDEKLQLRATDLNFLSQYKKKILCRGRLNGAWLTFEVLATSGCEADVSTKVPRQAIRLCINQPDFAILHPVQRMKPLPCLQIDRSQDIEDRDIVIVGYPRATERVGSYPDAQDSDGKSQYISFGKIKHSNFCRIDYGNLRGSFLIRDFDVLGDFIQADADAVEGNSGGPIILSDTGAIVGVLARSISTEKNYCRGSAFATSFSQMRKTQRFTTDETFDSFFACEKNAAISPRVAK